MSDPAIWGIVIIGLSIIFAWSWYWYARGFRRGQIGAMSSTKVMYSLEEKPDGSSRWEWAGGLNLADKFSAGSGQRKRVVVEYEVHDRPTGVGLD